MSANNQQERNAVEQVYYGILWQQKVRKMSDAQVHAIYIRLKQQGKIA